MKYKVKQLREQQDISRMKLEDITHIRSQTIMNVENGTANPTMYTLESIAKGLGCRVSDLLDE